MTEVVTLVTAEVEEVTVVSVFDNRCYHHRM